MPPLRPWGLTLQVLLVAAAATDLAVTATANGHQAPRVGLIVDFATVGAGVATWLPWFYRAHRVAARHAPAAVRYGPIASVTSWFIPILSIWRPVQLMNDVLTALEGTLRRPSRVLVVVWWVTPFVAAGTRRIDVSTDRAGDVLTLRPTWIGSALFAAFAVVAVVLVHRVTRAADRVTALDGAATATSLRAPV